MPRFLVLLACLSSPPLQAQTQPGKLVISHLSGDFYVFTTYRVFQEMPFPSNGLYLVTDSGVILIDTPWDTTRFQPLLDSIQARHHKKVILCLATHSHEDRTGGLAYYRQQGIRTYATRQTDEICRERQEKRAEFLLNRDTVFTAGRYRFETYYGGAGHTPDNIVVWFPQERLLYGGCLIKSTEAGDLGNLADADTQAWPATLKKIRKKFRKPRYIIPGHQGWTSNRSLEHTLALLKQYRKKKRA